MSDVFVAGDGFVRFACARHISLIQQILDDVLIQIEADHQVLGLVNLC